MYGRAGDTALTAAPAGALAVGGLDVLWWVVAISTLIAATLALLRLLPRRISGRSAGSRSGRGSRPRRPRRR